MTTLQQINEQIEILKKQAEEIRRNELATTIADINAKIAAFGIASKDLVFPKQDVKSSSRSAKVTQSKNPVPPKYKGPNGQVWSGRGLQPKWVASAISEGKSLNDLLIAA